MRTENFEFAARTPSLGIKSHKKTSLGKTKTPVPANTIAGTGDNPAVPPGLTHMLASTHAYYHTLAFDYEAPAPSHILRMFIRF